MKFIQINGPQLTVTDTDPTAKQPADPWQISGIAALVSAMTGAAASPVMVTPPSLLPSSVTAGDEVTVSLGIFTGASPVGVLRFLASGATGQGTDVTASIVNGKYKTTAAGTLTLTVTAAPLAPVSVSTTVAAAAPVATAPAQFTSSQWSLSTGLEAAQLVLNISALPSDGGSAITAIEYTTGGAWVALSGTGTGARVLQMPTSGATYSFAIRAVNAEGPGPSSTTKDATARAAVPAQFASSAWSVSTGNFERDIDLSVDTLPSNGGSAITAIEYNIGAGWIALEGTGTGKRSLQMEAGGASYSFMLRAVNAAGPGTASTAKSATSKAVTAYTGDALNPDDVSVLDGASPVVSAIDGLSLSGGGYARSIGSHRTGKKFFSVVVNSSTTSGIGAIGLAKKGEPIGSSIGTNTNAIAVYSNGYAPVDGAWPQWAPGFAVGSVVDVAVDLDARLWWHRVNGGQWNASASANPATGAGGRSIASLTGDLCVILQVDNANFTANFGSKAFPHAIPAGFKPWRDIPLKAKIGAGVWNIPPIASYVDGTAPAGAAPFEWFYDWKPEKSVAASVAEYVPMIWGRADLGKPITAGSKYVLGYNEPDGTGESHQANISVSQALADWPQLEAYGLPLGSPAPTLPGTLGSTSWLGQFMAGVASQGRRVDFMAVHYYSTNKDVAAFKTWLDQVYAAYKRPIWVTEWCLIDWNNLQAISVADAAKFAEEALKMLNAHPRVFRHAYFSPQPYNTPWGAGTTTSHLVNSAITTRTLVGDKFNAALLQS